MEFKNQYNFLSNFYTDSKNFCVEISYQSSKFINDGEIFKKIIKMKPGEAKRFANLPENQAKVRPDWKRVNLHIMEELIRFKFSNDPERSLLINTGDIELVEGNYWHDNFWGACTCIKCMLFKKSNNLGKILMKIREEIK